MAIKFEFGQDGIGVFRISGALKKSEMGKAQEECESIIKNNGIIKLLVILEEFSGWEHSEGWEDISFAERNDQFIEKMAIVGDQKWKDLVYAFTLKGLRSLPIEYFAGGNEAAARAWLNNNVT